jgi:hypothetical protein
MARWRQAAGAALAIALALAMQGCAREDGSRILGHWRAERVAFMALKLPLGPELHITRDRLASADGELALAITAITQEDDEVTLDTQANIGLTFHFVEPDRMYVELPLLDKIYYRRIVDNTPKPVAQRVAAPGRPASVPASTVPAAPARPVAEPAPASSAAGLGEQYYDQALVSARQGDDDSALHQLHRAFGAGFTGAERVAATPEFAHLRTDVRFQVLLSRYAGR